jgi:GT2 family glycosyltransferase
MINRSSSIPAVWAIVPCFNRSVSTLRFLRCFAQQDYPNKHIVVVDDGSIDNTTLNVLVNYPEAHVVRGDGNLWWAGGTNLGIRYALEQGCDYVLTINDDSQIPVNLVSRLVRTALGNDRYIVGCMIVEEDREDVVWSIGASMDFGSPGLMRLNFAGECVDVAKKLAYPYPVEFMPGNGVLLPRRLFAEVGFYDEVNFPQYHADSELVLRASRGGGYVPVIDCETRVVNHILRKPLVNNMRDLIFSKKSNLYWPALATLILRYFPSMRLEEAFKKLYVTYNHDLLALIESRPTS